jgi:hypothetical protein
VIREHQEATYASRREQAKGSGHQRLAFYADWTGDDVLVDGNIKESLDLRSVQIHRLQYDEPEESEIQRSQRPPFLLR